MKLANGRLFLDEELRCESKFLLLKRQIDNKQDNGGRREI